MINEKDQLKLFEIEHPIRFLQKANAFLQTAIMIHRDDRVRRSANYPKLPDVEGPELEVEMNVFHAKLDKYNEAERRARERKRTSIDEEDYKQLSMIYVGRAIRFLKAIPKNDYGVFEQFVGSIKEIASQVPEQLNDFAKLRDMHEHSDEYLVGRGRKQKDFIKEIKDGNGNRIAFGGAFGGWIKNDNEIWIGTHIEIVNLTRVLEAYATKFSEAYERLIYSEEFRKRS